MARSALLALALAALCALSTTAAKSCLDFALSGVVFVGVSFARGFKPGVNTYRRAISANLEMGGLDVDAGVVARVGVIDADGSAADASVRAPTSFFNANAFSRLAHDASRAFSAA